MDQLLKIKIKKKKAQRIKSTDSLVVPAASSNFLLTEGHRNPSVRASFASGDNAAEAVRRGVMPQSGGKTRRRKSKRGKRKTKKRRKTKRKKKRRKRRTRRKKGGGNCKMCGDNIDGAGHYLKWATGGLKEGYCAKCSKLIEKNKCKYCKGSLDGIPRGFLVKIGKVESGVCMKCHEITKNMDAPNKKRYRNELMIDRSNKRIQQEIASRKKTDENPFGTLAQMTGEDIPQRKFPNLTKDAYADEKENPLGGGRRKTKRRRKRRKKRRKTKRRR